MTQGAIQSAAFLFFAFVAIVSGISMLTAERVIHSAVFMLVGMFSVAGIFMLLGAEFLAAVQIVVYAGAVVVLVLFTIMLTVQRTATADRRRELSTGAGLVVLVFGGLIYAVLASRPLAFSGAAAPGVDVTQLGLALFSPAWVLPFELASVVLLIALVGAIYISLQSDR